MKLNDGKCCSWSILIDRVSAISYCKDMAGRHTREELLAFLKGENAQVVARDSRNGELVVMRQGGADALRAITKQYLLCPVEDCPDPGLEAIGGSTGRRHHFRHRTGGGHGSAVESLFHYQSKLILGAWAEASALEQGLRVRVQIDCAFVGVEVQKTRKPDVLIEFLETGEQLAFEVEYFNSTDVSSLNKRRSNYQDLGIKDIWLFGHASRHVKLKQSTSLFPSSSVKLDSVLARIGELRDPILVINPVEGLVGTLVQDTPTPHWRWWESTSSYGLNFATKRETGDCADVYLDSLDACRLDAQFGIVSPAMEKVWQSRSEIEILAKEAEAAFLKDRRDQDRALDLEIQSRIAIQRKIETFKTEQLKIWEEHPLRKSLIAFYGEIPAAIREKLFHDDGIYAHHEHWHALLFQQFIAGKLVGHQFTVPNVYGYLNSLGIRFGKNGKWRAGAIIDYLRYLHNQGYVKLDDEDRFGSRIDQPIEVLLNKIYVEPAKKPPIKFQGHIGATQSQLHWQAQMVQILRAEPKITFSNLKRRLPPTITDLELQDAWDFIDEGKEWSTEGDQN